MIAPMMPRKPTLGRGLADLLRPARPCRRAQRRRGTAATPAARAGEELAKLPLDLLQRGRYQPRVDMRAGDAQELADSIKAQGVVQPIVVRPLGVARRRRIAALRDHRRRAPLARGADGGAAAKSRRSSATFPTRPPSPWRSSRTSSARTSIRSKRRARWNGSSRVRAHAPAGRRRGRPLARRRSATCCACSELAPEVCEMLEKRALEMGHARALLALTQQAPAGRGRRAGRARRACRCAIPRRWCAACRQPPAAAAAAGEAGRPRPERAAPGAGAGREARARRSRSSTAPAARAGWS